jgi:hypothetical protein
VSESSKVYRFFRGWVALCERHPGKLLLALMVVAALATVAALRLELHTDFTELLPDKHPAVQAFHSIFPRQKSATNMVMIIHSPDKAANYKFVDALEPEVDKLTAQHLFTEIQWRPDTTKPDYFAKWKWLYADMKDLERAEDLLDRVITKRSSPLAVEIDGDADEELKKLRTDLNKKLPPMPETKYFEMTDAGEHWVGVLFWKKQDGFATPGDYETMRQVIAAVATAQPTKFHPQMKVQYTGNIAQVLDEQSGIKEDLVIATGLCLAGVLGIIWLYFRRTALIMVIGAPAILGVLLSLALASFTIRYLNINTQFLVSIIIGNGINPSIMLLARYGEERNKGRMVRESLVTALSETLVGTFTAMVGAAIAYGCLQATSFRGFSQFGLLGGFGMLFCWLVMFVLVPALVIWAERRWPSICTPKPNLWRRPFLALGKLVEKRPAVAALLLLASLVICTKPLWSFAKDPLEWDLNNLRTDNTASQDLWTRKEALGINEVGAGYVGNNAVFLVDKPEQADVVAEAIRKKDKELNGDKPLFKEVRTLGSLLPTKQEEKLEVLARVRKKIDKHVELMDDDEKAEVAAWRPPEYLRKLEVDDLWPHIKDAFTEVDGQRGRFIGIDADGENFYGWNGHHLLKIAKVLEVEALGKKWVAASSSTIFSGMLETIMADGPRVTMLALSGVALLMLVMFGLRGALAVLATLAVGIYWLGGALGQWSLKINFMNFVALPITLGVGAEYAANIWARHRNNPDAKISDIVADTGSAVALCSMTTIIGYATLLKSRNHALRSFGIVADIGEVTTLLAALLALPLLILVIKKLRKPPLAVEPS